MSRRPNPSAPERVRINVRGEDVTSASTGTATTGGDRPSQWHIRARGGARRRVQVKMS